MAQRLLFPDAEVAADLLTFAGRSARLGDGAIRIQARGGTLAASAAPLAPRGLLDSTPTVLGLRAVPTDPDLVCDLVVEAAALALAEDDRAAVTLPAQAVSPAWAGISPPRSGWSAAGEVEASVLSAQAQLGIARVAEALPQDAGDDVVRAIRARIWGEPEPGIAGLPRGAAFAAFALGFVSGAEQARVFASGPWRRLTLRRGHVLVRGPIVSGLTAVRTTGAKGE